MHSTITDESIRFGSHDDGTDASYVLYTTHSMWSGLLVGGTGSGYTHFLDRLLSNRPDNTLVWYLDNGSMSSVAEAESDWVVSRQFADEMLDEAIALIDRRYINQAVQHSTGFARSEQDPGVLLVIEDSHQILANSRLRRKVEDTAANGRKAGVAVLPVASDPMVIYGSQVLHRATGHNTIVMNTTGRRIPGVGCLPPSRPGNGYLIRDGQPTGFAGDF